MYEVAFEVQGPMAMFNRPDAGSTPVSYPVPTWSAAKGMFEAVARIQRVYVRPTRVEVCRPIRYERYTTNYGGPLRKSGQIRDGDNYQLKAVVLVDVCYRVFGRVERFEPDPPNANSAHALSDTIRRRLAAGQTLYTPCLGWKEFAPSYFGPLRDGTRPDTSINVAIPSLLHSVFDSPKLGRRAPYFHQDVQIVDGVLIYPVRPDVG